MKRLAQNLARCGLAADLVRADALDWRPETAPDAILLDAPCSATGTIRRHPDLPFRRDGSSIADLLGLQAHLIDHALSLLQAGGRLVYAVCSLLPDEGPRQIARALCNQPGWHISLADMDIGRLIGADGGLCDAPQGADIPVGRLLTPHHDGTDGFFFTRACRS